MFQRNVAHQRNRSQKILKMLLGASIRNDSDISPLYFHLHQWKMKVKPNDIYEEGSVCFALLCNNILKVVFNAIIIVLYLRLSF